MRSLSSILLGWSANALAALLFVAGSLHGFLAGASFALQLDGVPASLSSWLLASSWFLAGSGAGFWTWMILRARIRLGVRTSTRTRPGSPKISTEAPTS